jgi:uncharacterized protein with von Willebrand factor type A (vWA) domain
MPKQTQEYLEENPDRVKKMVEAFTKVVGNDKPENSALVEEFGKTMSDFQKEIDSAHERLGEQDQEVQEEAEAEEELNDGFDNIEEEYGIDLWDETNRKLKGQFLDYVEDISHKDRDGDIDEFPDLVGAYKSFSKIHQRENPTATAKDLADRSGNRSGSGAGSQKPTERITFDNIGDKIDRMFG